MAAKASKQLLILMRNGLADVLDKSGLLVTFFSHDYVIRETDVREKLIEGYANTTVGRMFAYSPDLLIMHPSKKYSDKVFFIKCLPRLGVASAGQQLKALKTYPQSSVAIVAAEPGKARLTAAWASDLDISRLDKSMKAKATDLSTFAKKELGTDLDQESYSRYSEQLLKLMGDLHQ